MSACIDMQISLFFEYNQGNPPVLRKPVKIGDEKAFTLICKEEQWHTS